MSKGPNPPPPVDRPPLRPEPERPFEPTEDPCAVPVSGRLTAPPIAVGTKVDAVPEGDDIAVYAEGGLIGWLGDPAASAVRRCASRGWRFVGVVTASVSGEVLFDLTPLPPL